MRGFKVIENSDVRQAFRSLWGNLTYGWFFGLRAYPCDWEKRGYLQPMVRAFGLGPVRIQWVTEGEVLPTVSCHVRRMVKRQPLFIGDE